MDRTQRSRGPSRRWLTAAVVTCLTLGGIGLSSSVAAPAAPTAAKTTQVGTWAASAARLNATVNNQTVRNIVRTNIGGTGLRVSLSNVFGTLPVTFGRVTVGLQESGATVVPGTNRQVTFSGRDSITVPPGADVLSDPLPGEFAAQQNLAISVYVQGTTGTVTGHSLAMQTSYVSTAGDHAAEDAATAFPTSISNWYWLDGVTMTKPAKVTAVAALGDSITDGLGSTANTNSRWPDVLARRLLERPEVQQLGVLNEGISGNRVLTDGAGVSALARFDRDVLAQPGVETVILLEGINDINGGATADSIIAGYRQLIARAHAEGTCIVGGTLTPFERNSDQAEAARTTVNDFIRNSGEFDGIVDFDLAIRDPAKPDRMLAPYDSGDTLHPSSAGYLAMGNAVDLKLLDCDL